MIQIRNSMFETNSSSCHVFMFPNGMNIKIPSTVILNDDYNTKDNMPNLYFNDINWGESYTTPFIQFLYKCGVKKIKYTGKYKYVTDAIEKYKNLDDYDLYGLYNDAESIKKVCFGDNVKITTMEDYMVSDEEVSKCGNFEDWCAIRLS